MTGDINSADFQKTVDSTGDPYEDFPEDQLKDGDFKGPEIIKIATELKDFGNKAFKGGDVILGLGKYQKGIRYLNEYPAASDEDPPETIKQLTSIRFALHSNSALLHNKLKAFEEAKQSASHALQLEGISDADRGKAYYRRALANEGLKDDEEAMNDLQSASKLSPNVPDIANELAKVKKRAADQAKKEKAAFKKFFD